MLSAVGGSWMLAWWVNICVLLSIWTALSILRPFKGLGQNFSGQNFSRQEFFLNKIPRQKLLLTWVVLKQTHLAHPKKCMRCFYREKSNQMHIYNFFVIHCFEHCYKSHFFSTKCKKITWNIHLSIFNRIQKKKEEEKKERKKGRKATNDKGGTKHSFPSLSQLIQTQLGKGKLSAMRVAVIEKEKKYVWYQPSISSSTYDHINCQSTCRWWRQKTRMRWNGLCRYMMDTVESVVLGPLKSPFPIPTAWWTHFCEGRGWILAKNQKGCAWAHTDPSGWLSSEKNSDWFLTRESWTNESEI